MAGCNGCICCGNGLSSASGATSTSPTDTEATSSGNASPATTGSSRNGTQAIPMSPYLDIAVDVVNILHGTGAAEITPHLRIAAIAIECELAERLLADDDLAHSPKH